MRIKSIISIILVLIILLGMMTIPANAITFTDVKSGAWYYNAVMWCAKSGLMTGYGNGVFSPNKPITRAEFAAILYKATINIANEHGDDCIISYGTKDRWVGGKSVILEGWPNFAAYMMYLQGDLSYFEKQANPFSDVKQNYWYTKAINYCYGKGIINGIGNNKFAPNAYITRQDAMLMLMRWWFAINHLVKGDTTTFSPKNIINTGEKIDKYKYSDRIFESNPYYLSIGMAYNKDAYDLKKQAVFRVFTDANQISGYAMSAMTWATTVKMLQGYPVYQDGAKFVFLGPKEQISRAQVAQILYRMFEEYAASNDPWWYFE